MRYIVALLGALCLLGGVCSAVDITGVVTNFTNSGLAAMNTAFSQFINATTAADKQVNTSLAVWNTSLVNNLTAIGNKFVNYSGFIDTSNINAAISSIMVATVASIAADPTLNNLYCGISARAQQSAAALIAFAGNASANVTGCTSDFSSQCLTKYAANLTSAGVNISRFGACLTNETSRITVLAANISSYISTNLAISASLFNLTNICYIPTVAQLNAAQNAGMAPPSMSCLTQYLGGFANNIPNTLSYATVGVPPQTQGIMNRAQRCADITALDIQDTLTAIATAYNNCLMTGS